MAEEDSGQEKTEDPTPKRLRDAREKGDVARSKELNTTILLMAAAGAILMFGGSASQRIASMMSSSFELRREEIFDLKFMFINFSVAVEQAIFALLGFAGVVLVAAFIGPISMSGWNFSSQAVQPKFNRMNPLSGLKRMFSLKALVELAKALGKFIVVTGLAVLVLSFMKSELYSLGLQSSKPGIEHAVIMIAWAFLILSLSMIAISLVDVPFVLYDYTEKLKMTLQEVKDEMKNTEGKPEVKGRIRQLQREISQRQMMKDVPTADVVITNPTHYSVALKYDPSRGEAPVMIAKGADFVAFKIREVAKENEVPILSSPALARALYFSTEIGDEIPAGLFKAVAQVLAYVFQLRSYRNRAAEAPTLPNNDSMEIPEEYRFD